MSYKNEKDGLLCIMLAKMTVNKKIVLKKLNTSLLWIKMIKIEWNLGESQ